MPFAPTPLSKFTNSSLGQTLIQGKDLNASTVQQRSIIYGELPSHSVVLLHMSDHVLQLEGLIRFFFTKSHSLKAVPPGYLMNLTWTVAVAGRSMYSNITLTVGGVLNTPMFVLNCPMARMLALDWPMPRMKVLDCPMATWLVLDCPMARLLVLDCPIARLLVSYCPIARLLVLDCLTAPVSCDFIIIHGASVDKYFPFFQTACSILPTRCSWKEPHFHASCAEHTTHQVLMRKRERCSDHSFMFCYLQSKQCNTVVSKRHMDVCSGHCTRHAPRRLTTFWESQSLFSRGFRAHPGPWKPRGLESSLVHFKSLLGTFTQFYLTLKTLFLGEFLITFYMIILSYLLYFISKLWFSQHVSFQSHGFKSALLSCCGLAVLWDCLFWASLVALLAAWTENLALTFIVH